jgi:hypothetical protein
VTPVYEVYRRAIEKILCSALPTPGANC